MVGPPSRHDNVDRPIIVVVTADQHRNPPMWIAPPVIPRIGNVRKGPISVVTPHHFAIRSEQRHSAASDKEIEVAVVVVVDERKTRV
jgi:hypothetical protein